MCVHAHCLCVLSCLSVCLSVFLSFCLSVCYLFVGVHCLYIDVLGSVLSISLVQLQAHDLEKQLQIALTDKQQLSDQLNDTMTQLNGHHQPSNYHNQLETATAMFYEPFANYSPCSVDPEVTHLKLDLHKATEENENKEHQIEELCSQLASLQKIIEGERSKNCEAEGRMKRLEV